MGIDYGRGQTNIDNETGIRYGIIPANNVMSEALSGFDYPDMLVCPECQTEILPDDPRLEMENDDGMTECPQCGQLIYSERFGEWVEDYDGPLYYNDAEYALMLDSNNDVWIFKSPYKAKAGYCSPCAPGAVYLTDKSQDDYGYALGPEWFEDEITPYDIELV